MPPYSTHLDAYNKERVIEPTRWTLFVTIRFNKFDGKQKPVSYSDHKDDLNFVADTFFPDAGLEVAADWKIDSDMGSESNYLTDKALLNLADVFERNLLGTLVVGGHCTNGGNQIKTFWSPLKTSISGMLLSDTVDSDDLLPDRQTELTHQQMVRKDLKVFKNAGEYLKRSWTRMKVGGHAVQVRYILPQVMFPLFLLISILH